MFLLCKCGCHLTKSLRPAKSWKRTKRVEEFFTLSEGGELSNKSQEVVYDYEVNPGTYIESNALKEKRLSWIFGRKRVSAFHVSKTDVVSGVLPDFKAGMGCCDHHFEEGRCPSCKVVVCYAFLDCYDSKSVIFDERNIVRSYRA